MAHIMARPGTGFFQRMELMMEALKAGARAPEFELNATPDQRIKLSDFRGQRVILVFYPADWSPVCGDQLALYNELRDEFAKHKAMCIGISVDGAWCHAAFRENRGYKLALLSDFEPKGQVARDYSVYRTREGVSERALFVIDEEGVIRWTYVSPIGINPGADGILKALEEMDGSKS
jgi:peroxiredoxin